MTTGSEPVETGNEGAAPGAEASTSTDDRSEYLAAEAARAFEARDEARRERDELRRRLEELEPLATEATDLRAQLEAAEARQAAARTEVETIVREARERDLKRSLRERFPGHVKDEAISILARDVDLMADGFDASKAADAVFKLAESTMPQLLSNGAPPRHLQRNPGGAFEIKGLDPMTRPRGRKAL